jgi:hypothetical protein
MYPGPRQIVLLATRLFRSASFAKTRSSGQVINVTGQERYGLLLSAVLLTMSCNFKFGGMKALLAMGGLLFLLASSATAQTSSGQLTITMSVQSSITLIFQDNPSVGTVGFCPLTNAGTNNVGLDFGTAAFPGSFHTLACVNYQHIGAAVYQVSSAFDVVVTKSNSSSPNYRLAAQISTPPPANVSWLLNNVTLTTAGFTTLDTADNYATPITKTLQVQVKNSVPAQAFLETITFLATAN